MEVRSASSWAVVQPHDVRHPGGGKKFRRKDAADGARPDFCHRGDRGVTGLELIDLLTMAPALPMGAGAVVYL